MNVVITAHAFFDNEIFKIDDLQITSHTTNDIRFDTHR